MLFFCINNLLLNVISNSTPSLGTNTPFSYRKSWKSCMISFFAGAYISFVHLTKSSLIHSHSVVSLYLLSLQCAIWCNKNPFKSCLLIFSGLIMAVSHVCVLCLWVDIFFVLLWVGQRHNNCYFINYKNEESESCLICNWVVIMILQSVKIH